MVNIFDVVMRPFTVILRPCVSMVLGILGVLKPTSRPEARTDTKESKGETEPSSMQPASSRGSPEYTGEHSGAESSMANTDHTSIVDTKESTESSNTAPPWLYMLGEEVFTIRYDAEDEIQTSSLKLERRHCKSSTGALSHLQY